MAEAPVAGESRGAFADSAAVGAAKERSAHTELESGEIGYGGMSAPHVAYVTLLTEKLGVGAQGAG